ncbi:MAG TPA: FAD-dependent tricarballylate dehydrogenase TcuA [bacterium]|nr:FAD-dependent tricarballylate dehydrogenase TcuA [bacterium]
MSVASDGPDPRDAGASYDVIVVGGGHAALSAALSARRTAARVLILERAPRHMRGGNSRHTRNVRCAHDPGDAYLTGEYGEDEFLDDLRNVGGGQLDAALARFAVRESKLLPAWMTAHGVGWQRALRGTLSLSRTNRFFLGGGKALVNTYYETCRRLGVEVRYESSVADIRMAGRRAEAVVVDCGGSRTLVRGHAVVVAAGGFEANLDWLRRYWGDAADNFAVRGTPYNDGTMLAVLLDKGAMQVGDPKGFHAIAVDARAPKYDGGIATRLDSIPFGIVVNRVGERFSDEGEDLWPKRYATWGARVAAQPGQIAYSIVDAKAIGCFLPPLYKPVQADSVAALAARLQIDAGALVRTVDDYNRATVGNTAFRADVLDGLATRGLRPAKSNWARPLDRPPFSALPLRPGITFTYMGVGVDETARVVDRHGQPFVNLYAAGEIMSGNILASGYLAGFGMTIGGVFGRLAGREAATHAGH